MTTPQLRLWRPRHCHCPCLIDYPNATYCRYRRRLKPSAQLRSRHAPALALSPLFSDQNSQFPRRPTSTAAVGADSPDRGQLNLAPGSCPPATRLAASWTRSDDSTHCAASCLGQQGNVSARTSSAKAPHVADNWLRREPRAYNGPDADVRYRLSSRSILLRTTFRSTIGFAR